MKAKVSFKVQRLYLTLQTDEQRQQQEKTQWWELLLINVDKQYGLTIKTSQQQVGNVSYIDGILPVCTKLHSDFRQFKAGAHTVIPS